MPDIRNFRHVETINIISYGIRGEGTVPVPPQQYRPISQPIYGIFESGKKLRIIVVRAIYRANNYTTTFNSSTQKEEVVLRVCLSSFF